MFACNSQEQHTRFAQTIVVLLKVATTFAWLHLFNADDVFKPASPQLVCTLFQFQYFNIAATRLGAAIGPIREQKEILLTNKNNSYC